MPLKKNYLVEKQNQYGVLTTAGLSLQEKRLFDVYAAKINSKQPNSRCVKFTVRDFASLFGIKGSIPYGYLNDITTHLLQQVVALPRRDGGIDKFPLFIRCSLYWEHKEFYIEMEAHPKSMALFFWEKNIPFYRYTLENIRRIKTTAGYQLYNLLKKNSFRNAPLEIEVSDLRILLGIMPGEYSKWYEFKRRVLDQGVTDVNRNTDIFCSYSKGRGGKGGAWLSVVFDIRPQPKGIQESTGETTPSDPEKQLPAPTKMDHWSLYPEHLQGYAELCSCEFTEEQLQVIHDRILNYFGKGSTPLNVSELDLMNLFSSKYNELNLRGANTAISNRFRYFYRMFSDNAQG